MIIIWALEASPPFSACHQRLTTPPCGSAAPPFIDTGKLIYISFSLKINTPQLARPIDIAPLRSSHPPPLVSRLPIEWTLAVATTTQLPGGRFFDTTCVKAFSTRTDGGGARANVAVVIPAAPCGPAGPTGP